MEMWRQNLYLDGIGTEINKERGFELYNEAADKKNSSMQYNFDEEIIDNLDEINKINYWYHKAADDDNKFALYKLGEHYELGKGIYFNERRAIEFYKKSADQGFVDAQYKLGYIYDHGTEIEINKEKAFEYYKMAAKGGNVKAQRSLASLHEQGKGIEKNINEAIYWYKKAVENGCQEAEKNLSSLLNNW